MAVVVGEAGRAVAGEIEDGDPDLGPAERRLAGHDLGERLVEKCLELRIGPDGREPGAGRRRVGKGSPDRFRRRRLGGIDLWVGRACGDRRTPPRERDHHPHDPQPRDLPSPHGRAP